MIMTVEELKSYISTNESDEVLEGKLQALELLIRKYTNNNFQIRSIRFLVNVVDGGINLETPLLNENDTIQISQSLYNDGVYYIKSKSGQNLILNDVLIIEDKILITKIKYPQDVKMGVVNMMKWELENRDKVGIKSETISRHSVTYFNMDGDDSIMGFPKSLLGFLEPYKKARF
ncbi:hypothetical protein DXB93_15345 [Thomasclavelia ramosa]|uniref:Uncharacterized protein n=2 Tax=Thomasclavelia ramosa TaxID=1547 RepID=A0A3E3EAA2_9FIRM|nr:hypothetical protein DXB93_15345 [Thomasclavelia ramosa]